MTTATNTTSTSSDCMTELFADGINEGSRVRVLPLRNAEGKVVATSQYTGQIMYVIFRCGDHAFLDSHPQGGGFLDQNV